LLLIDDVLLFLYKPAASSSAHGYPSNSGFTSDGADNLAKDLSHMSDGVSSSWARPTGWLPKDDFSLEAEREKNRKPAKNEITALFACGLPKLPRICGRSTTVPIS